MDPQLLRGGFRIGIVILGLALITLPLQPRDSAEFVVTVMAAIVGAAFVIGIALLARGANPRVPSAGNDRKEYNRRSRGGGQ